MPVYYLENRHWFPPTHLATEEGILAIGGDLSPERLLLAYHRGIFPWYNEEDPIIWWAPDPRFVLFPDDLKVSKSMKQVLRSGKFRVTIDHDFEGVINNCRTDTRRGQEGGTWLNLDLMASYVELYRKGYAHSVEVWEGNELVGGLYGLSLGNCFFGESMFAKVSNASKAGFILFVKKLQEMGFNLVDCQYFSSHLESLGAQHIPREQFEQLLPPSDLHQMYRGAWDDWDVETVNNF